MAYADLSNQKFDLKIRKIPGKDLKCEDTIRADMNNQVV